MHYLTASEALKNAKILPHFNQFPYFFCSKSRSFTWILNGTGPANVCAYCGPDQAKNHFLEVPAWHHAPKLQGREYIYRLITAPGSQIDLNLFTYLVRAGHTFTRRANGIYILTSVPAQFANIKTNIL